MPFVYSPKEIIETVRMVDVLNLDVRTVTLGVNLRDCCDPDIDKMKEKIFNKIVGKAEVLGHPMLYGTTKKFLEAFGLNSLKDLPKIEELKKPSS